MQYIRVKNLEKYQHYKDRNITSWIKIDCKILDDPHFFILKDFQKYFWIGILILSSRNKNLLPLDYSWIARRISNSKPQKIKEAIDIFLSLEWVEITENSRPSLDRVYSKDFKELKTLNIPSQIENLLMSFKESTREKIRLYMEGVASLNKSKKVSLSRKRTLLLELVNSRERCEDEALLCCGLDASVKYKAYNIYYINAVIKNSKMKI